MELANVQIQSGHLMRIILDRQMKGFNLYARINDYIISLKIQMIWGLYVSWNHDSNMISYKSQDNLVKE
jgi:hypothetical protein